MKFNVWQVRMNRNSLGQGAYLLKQYDFVECVVMDKILIKNSNDEDFEKGDVMKYNFNRQISICKTCAHFNLNAGSFSFCLMQDRDVFEGDYCDMHTKSYEVARKREMKELQYMGTIFDRGDGKADFGNSKRKS